MLTGLNVGSGQRRFESTPEVEWVNVDCVSRPPDQVPDLICDVGREPLPYPDNSVAYVVLHQVYEHFGLGEGHGLIQEAYRVLQPDGSMIITVPNAERLAQRRALGQITNFIYNVNIMGAFQGLESDRHKWCFWNLDALIEDIDSIGLKWSRLKRFDQRPIPGADIAHDWWILELECVK